MSVGENTISVHCNIMWNTVQVDSNLGNELMN